MKFISLIKKSFKDDIVRRVFIKNTFDGVITILGILIAFYLTNFSNAWVIIFSCLGSGIAIAVSGIFGAYLTERAERRLKIKKLEKQLLRSLKGTILSKKSINSSIIVALFDGLPPLITTIIILIPFLLIFIPIQTAYLFSFLISSLIIVFLGILISKISKEKILPNVLKMFGAALTVTTILYLIEVLKN